MEENGKTKKVLIISSYSGTRIPGLLKYLPESGWQPVLLTMLGKDVHQPPPGLKIIRTPYRDALSFWKKLFKINAGENLRTEIKNQFSITSKKSVLDHFLTIGSAIINYPDAEKGWKSFAIKAADELFQREKIDAVISSSSPVTAHIIAGELKKRYKIPWVADLRDLWSQNHNYSYGPIRKWLDKKLELKTFSGADALVTVSQPWAEKLSAIHKSNKIYSFTNGFDPDEVNDSPAGLTAKLTITHTGSIYTGKQNPLKLFAALQSLLSAGALNPNDIEVRFYGPELDWLDKEIEKYGVSGVVKQCGLVSRQVSLEKQRESQMLLLLDWDNPLELGVHTLKIFEYLGARRPVLAIGGVAGNVVDVLLDETQAGVHPPSIEDIKNALKRLYETYKSEGKIPYNGIIAEIDKYSHRTMAQKFAGVLDNLTENRP